jgi:hypothetical protein
MNRAKERVQSPGLSRRDSCHARSGMYRSERRLHNGMG